MHRPLSRMTLVLTLAAASSASAQLLGQDDPPPMTPWPTPVATAHPVTADPLLEGVASPTAPVRRGLHQDFPLRWVDPREDGGTFFWVRRFARAATREFFVLEAGEHGYDPGSLELRLVFRTLDFWRGLGGGERREFLADLMDDERIRWRTNLAHWEVLERVVGRGSSPAAP